MALSKLIYSWFEIYICCYLIEYKASFKLFDCNIWNPDNDFKGENRNFDFYNIFAFLSLFTTYCVLNDVMGRQETWNLEKNIIFSKQNFCREAKILAMLTQKDLYNYTAKKEKGTFPLITLKW